MVFNIDFNFIIFVLSGEFEFLGDDSFYFGDCVVFFGFDSSIDSLMYDFVIVMEIFFRNFDEFVDGVVIRLSGKDVSIVVK